MDFEKFALIDDIDTEENEEDAKYSKKISIPQYLPSRNKPDIRMLYNNDKYIKLCHKISNATNITEDEKRFLMFAATRHIVFNYSQIADYYAHSNKEMQELMEESALVIIDFDDAIANGYVKLSKNIEEIMKVSGRVAEEKKEGVE